MTSLDDLLSYDDEPPRGGPRPRRPTLGTLAVDVLVAVALTALILMALRVAELSVPVALVFAAVLALRILGRQVRALPVAPPVHRRRPGDPTAAEPVPDGVYTASIRWQGRLDASWRDGERFATLITPRLVEIVDQRLRLRHGVSRAADPERARELVGEPLWTFLYSSGRRSPSPRELAAMVTRAEEL